MSLLRVCQQALPKHAIPRPITAYTRANSTAPTPPVQTGDLQEKQSTEITTPPEREVIVADAISGAPGESFVVHGEMAELVVSADNLTHEAELRHRSVRIYQPTRNTMQSGRSKGERWRIDWDILQGAGRWENPLMGWASS